MVMKRNHLLRLASLIFLPLAFASVCTVSCNRCSSVPTDSSAPQADSTACKALSTERISYTLDTAFTDGALTWNAEIDYPTGHTSDVQQAVLKWIDTQLGGSYGKPLDQPRKHLKYYAETFVRQHGENAPNTGNYSSDIEADYEMRLYKEYDCKHWVTYSVHSYRLLNDDGEVYQDMVTFTKPQGKILDWHWIDTRQHGRLSGIISRQMDARFKLSSVYGKPLAGYLLPSVAADALPLPTSGPALTSRMVINYQPGEIADRRFGMLSCTVPYDSLQDIISTETSHWLNEGRATRFP